MPALKAPILTLAVRATAALTEARAVSHAGGLPAAGGAIFGVANYSGAAGDDVPLDVLGTTIAEVGGAVAVGDALEALADGRLVTASTGTVVARARQAAGAAGEKIEVLLVAH